MRPIIGIAGPKQSGKNTAAAILAEMMEGYVQLAFASPLKAMLEVGLGLHDMQLDGPHKELVDPRYGRTPRELMQSLGGWLRETHPDMLLVLMRKNLAMHPQAIVTDVRMDNEASFLRDKGAVILHMEGRTQYSQETATECGVRAKKGDLIVPNCGGLVDLRHVLTTLVVVSGRFD